MKQPEDTRRIKPLYVVLGAVLAVAMVAFVLMNFVLFQSSDTAAVSTPAPSAVVPAVEPAVKPKKVEVFETFEGRDPFKPLAVAAAPAAPAAPPAPPAPAAPAATQAPAPKPTAKPAAVKSSAVGIKVLKVNALPRSANVQVGDKVHNGALAGSVLSQGVTLLRIDGACAVLARGGGEFKVCEGQTVEK